MQENICKSNISYITFKVQLFYCFFLNEINLTKYILHTLERFKEKTFYKLQKSCVLFYL